MIKPVVVAAVVAVALSVAPRAAQAGGPGYPWCASYSTGLNECNFVTWEQCHVAINGVGGVCSPNPRFQGYLPPPHKYVRWRWW
jgi:hypothetical protein